MICHPEFISGSFNKIEDASEGIDSSELTGLKTNQVLETMNTLKENYKICLTLHLIEGYDYEEIGTCRFL